MVVTMVASSINQAWVPWFMEKLSRNKADEIKQATKPYTFVVVIGGILIGLAAPEIIMIIGGEEYLEAVDLIPVIVLKCILAFFYTLYVNIEFYLKKTALISMITVLVSCVGLTISYISIPLWGYTAAAYGALISSGLELLLHAMCVKRLGMSCIYDNAFIAKMVVVACISCVFILSIYQHSFIRQILLIVLVFIFFQRCRFVMDMR